MGNYLSRTLRAVGAGSLRCFEQKNRAASQPGRPQKTMAYPTVAVLMLALMPGYAASTYQISTVAGSNSIGDNGPAGLASLADAGGVCSDAAGNIYVSDTANNRIRRIDLSGTITTI